MFPTIALADAITSVSPQSFYLYNVEQYITIDGSGLTGLQSTEVQFSGPAGTFLVEPNNASSEQLIVWVPVPIALQEGTYTVTVHAIDSDTVTRVIGPGSFTVAVRPNADPPLLGLPEVLVAEATSPSGAIVTFTAGADSGSIACDHTSGALFPMGTTTVSCTATNSFGTSGGTFLVVVTDTVPPVITVPSDITSSSPVVTFTATATDAIDGTIVPTCSPASGATFPVGTTTVTCTATDAHLNVTHASFDVTITQAPTLTLPADFAVEATSAAGAVVTYTATADQGATVACSPASGSTFPLGMTTVSCTATSTGGTTTGSFHVSVVDTTPPSITVPADITKEATGPTGAAVTFTVSATDLVDGSVAVTCTPASGSTFPIATTLVQCTATDAHHNLGKNSFSVTVRDTTPPVVTVPANITAEATGPTGAVVTFTATATDLVDGTVSVTCSPASGSTFPLGTTQVTCSATDAHQNTGSGKFSVTVGDTTPPTIVKLVATPSVLWPPNHLMVGVTIDAVVTDLVDPSPFVHIISVSSNQPVNGTGDGDTAPDWVITGPMTVDLRAERAGVEDRVYTITVEAVDASGNAATSTVTVVVAQHSRSRAAH